MSRWSMTQERARLGGYAKAGNAAAAEKKRREIREAMAEQYIVRLLDQAPPLSAETRTRLATILANG